MSYIEEKYTDKILEILDSLSDVDQKIKELLEDKSIKHSNKIATLCAQCNKELNLILKKYYPEIKNLDNKLQIKSRMKFYFELIDKITDYIRNVENFQKLDDKYYELIIEFIRNKEFLISGKFTDISSKELIVFYDKTTRANLEDILEKKLKIHDRKYFTIGPLEEEIKKIATIAGADEVAIFNDEEMVSRFNFIENPRSIIYYSVYSEDEELLKEIGTELKIYLGSKGYKAMVFITELSDIPTGRKMLTSSIITNANLNPE
ncbi:MAG: hypothetical protein ACTSV5_09235 [Promethearchaeota archaeon]